LAEPFLRVGGRAEVKTHHRTASGLLASEASGGEMDGGGEALIGS
jgi:hypothetical protein